MNKSIHSDKIKNEKTYSEVLYGLLEKMENSKKDETKIGGIKVLIHFLSEKGSMALFVEFKSWARKNNGIEGHLGSLGLNQVETAIVTKEIKQRLIKSNLEK